MTELYNLRDGAGRITELTIVNKQVTGGDKIIVLPQEIVNSLRLKVHPRDKLGLIRKSSIASSNEDHDFDYYIVNTSVRFSEGTSKQLIYMDGSFMFMPEKTNDFIIIGALIDTIKLPDGVSFAPFNGKA